MSAPVATSPTPTRAVGPDATFVTRLDGPSTESAVAADLVRRSAVAAVALIAVGGAGWGTAGAVSAAYATALVAGNFALAAWLMATTARISLGLFMGTVLFGYVLRLAAIFGAVWIVTGAGWYEPVPLGLALVTAHLGLLVWELRHVSATLAHPGLKPGARSGAPEAATTSTTRDHKETSS